MISWEQKLKYRRFKERHPKFVEGLATTAAVVVLLIRGLATLILLVWLFVQVIEWLVSITS